MTSLLLLVLLAAEPPANPAPEAKSEPAKKAARPGRSKKTAKREPAETYRVLDPTYRPNVGDRVVLLSRDARGESYDVWAATSPQAYQQYNTALVMDNEKQTDELEKDGKVVILDDETPVLVTSLDSVNEVVGFQQVGNAVGAAVRVSPVAVVRVLDGPMKNKTFLTPITHLVRFVEVAETPQRNARSSKKAAKPKKPSAEAPAPKPADPAARAAALLRLGQALEKSGKTAGALDFYRSLVKQYPNTPQAKTAAARIEALGQP